MASSPHPAVQARGARHRLDRGTALTLTALLVVAVAAWAGVVVPALTSDAPMAGMESGSGMAGKARDAALPPTFGDPISAAAFVAAWVVMMMAMMLPSAAPMVLLYRRMTAGSSTTTVLHTAVFVAAYLVIWALFGFGVYLVQQTFALASWAVPLVAQVWPFLVAGTLAGAGVYQFSSLKDRCLRQCRSPLSFVMTRWRPGTLGGVRLGLEHGAYCVGCCWGLMVVLVVAGGMGLAWVALIALVVFAEKLLPPGKAAGRWVGALLIALAAAVVLRPELASQLAM